MVVSQGKGITARFLSNRRQMVCRYQNRSRLGDGTPVVVPNSKHLKVQHEPLHRGPGPRAGGQCLQLASSVPLPPRNLRLGIVQLDKAQIEIVVDCGLQWLDMV